MVIFQPADKLQRSVKTPCCGHFEISFSYTFDTFKILYIFHAVVMRKLDFSKTKLAERITNVEYLVCSSFSFKTVNLIMQKQQYINI